MILKNTFSLLFIHILIINEQFCKKNYTGYKVYLMRGDSNNQREIMLELSDNLKYDFLKMPSYIRREAEVLVAPEHQSTFEEELENYGIQYFIVNDDVESNWNVAQKHKTKRKHVDKNRHLSNTILSPPTDHYMTYEEINNFLDILASEYPKKINVTVVGKSYEKRDIKLVIISTNKRNDPFDRDMIMIEAGVHSREWVPIATALLFIYNLVVHSSEDIEDLLDYEWLIMPLVNPDGYVYTHTTDRLWHKTRRPLNDSDCYGVDINRNFEYTWGGDGSSSKECHSHYRGPFPFSELESKVLRDVILKYKDRVKLFLSLHSFGSFILHPWAHSSEEPRGIMYMSDLAWEGANAIRIYTGYMYGIGSAAWKLYNYTGSSFDYAFAIARIPNVFMIITRGNGTVAYNPSETEIHLLTEEVWVGVKSMISHLSDNSWEGKHSYAVKYYATWPLITIAITHILLLI